MIKIFSPTSKDAQRKLSSKSCYDQSGVWEREKLQGKSFTTVIINLIIILPHYIKIIILPHYIITISLHQEFYHCHHQPCHNSLSISSFYHLYIIFISYHNTPLTISSLFEWPFGLSSSIYQYCHPIILIIKSLLFSNIFFIFTSFPRCKNSDTRDIKLNSHHRQCGCYGWLVGWLVGWYHQKSKFIISFPTFAFLQKLPSVQNDIE